MSLAPVLPAYLPAADRPRLTIVADPEPPPSGSDTTWGELVDRAGRVLLRRDRIGCGTRAELAVAVRAYHELLATAGRAWCGLWGTALPPRPARALGALLPRQQGLGVPFVASNATLARLRRSAVLLGAATDLIATHRSRAGRGRAPASEALDEPGSLAGGAVVLARMLVRVARFGLSLEQDAHRLRCRRHAFCVLLEDPSALLAAATRVIDGDAGGGAEHVIGGLTVARPGLAQSGPAELLRSRLERQIRSAWRWRERSDVSVQTLTDLAAWACDLQVYLSGRRTWAQLAFELADLRCPMPLDRRVRSDLLATRVLLARVLPRAAAMSIVEQTVQMLPALARWNGSAFDAVCASPGRSVLVAGRAIGDDELDEHAPALISARLRDGVAPAPVWRVDAVHAAYARLAGDP